MNDVIGGSVETMSQSISFQMPVIAPAVYSGLALANNTVLLVDEDANTRYMRANVLRDRGLHVVCAASSKEARKLWSPKSFKLVLFDARTNPTDCTELASEMKASSPKQLVAYFVGKPSYLASGPADDQRAATKDSPISEMLRSVMANVCREIPEGHGILEAVLRIASNRVMQKSRNAKESDLNGRLRMSFAEAIRRAS